MPELIEAEQLQGVRLTISFYFTVAVPDFENIAYGKASGTSIRKNIAYIIKERNSFSKCEIGKFLMFK